MDSTILLYKGSVLARILSCSCLHIHSELTVVICSIIFNEIEILNQRQSEILYNHRAFLDKVLDLICPYSPDITTQRNGQHILLNTPDTFDILRKYLRPQTLWDPPGRREVHTWSDKTKEEGIADILSGD